MTTARVNQVAEATEEATGSRQEYDIKSRTWRVDCEHCGRQNRFELDEDWFCSNECECGANWSDQD